MNSKVFLFVFAVLSIPVGAQQYSPQEISLITSGRIDTALPVLQTTQPHEHSVLLAQSTDANPTDPNTKILVNRMKLALQDTDGGVGIAAPQVGINRNIIWVQRFDKEASPLEYFINPQIIWKSDLLNLGPEGDLSIPDFRAQLYRSKVIRLRYYDLSGAEHEEMAEGFTAVIFQHEIDHLSGILISDKWEKEKVEAYQRVP